MTRLNYRGPETETPPDGFQPVVAIVEGRSHRGAFRVAGRFIEVTFRDAATRVVAGALRPEVAARLTLQKMVTGRLPPPPSLAVDRTRPVQPGDHPCTRRV